MTERTLDLPELIDLQKSKSDSRLIKALDY